MNWNRPLADDVDTCALGLRLDSTCAVASRYLKSAPVMRAACRMAPVTVLLPVGSTIIAAFGRWRSRRPILSGIALGRQSGLLTSMVNGILRSAVSGGCNRG